MASLSSRSAVLPMPASAGRQLQVPLALGVGTVVIAGVAVTQPGGLRALFAMALLVNLLIMSVRWPRAAIVVTLAYLPFMALIRRLLISDAGWSSQDPLLLVVPATAAFLVYRVYAARGLPKRLDAIYKIVLALAALMLLEIFNPGGNGFAAAVGGLLFLAVPLLWFVVGRELLDRRTVKLLIYGAVGAAVISSAYGLFQTESYFPAWDKQWIDVTGYTSLTVGEKVRAFGTFPSATEYATYSGIGFLLALAMVLHRKMLMLAVVPFLAVAIFLASGRSVLALTLIGLMVMLAVRTRSRATGTFVLILGVATLFMVSAVLGPTLDRVAGQTQDSLVSHQIGGLLHPLDPNKSTAIGHLDLVVKGVKTGLTHPFGQGTGVTNLAATQVGGKEGAGTSEVDISDVFIALGLAGGLLYMAAIVLTFSRTIKRYAATEDALVLAVVGVIVVSFGHWLDGGHYTTSALTWLMIGWATRPWRDRPEPVHAAAGSSLATADAQPAP